MMRLNTFKPAYGSHKDSCRLGRGMSSGKGKTGGRGHKGQHSRSGGYHKIGFEGGQMPLQRRLPKLGFISRKKTFTNEIRISELEGFSGDLVNLTTLKNAKIIPRQTRKVKIINTGTLSTTLVCHLTVSKGARVAIQNAGGVVVNKK